MKKCKACLVEKDILLFSKNKNSIDGFQDRCKLCHKQYRELNKSKNISKNHDETLLHKCNKCGQNKYIIEFSSKLNSPSGIEYWCLLCKQQYSKEHRNKNIIKYRLDNNKRRKDRVNWLQSLKDNIPCKDCNKIYEPHCMDFDHLGGKINSISRMVLQNVPKNVILDEIKKCELVCVLCHNIRTQKRLDEKFKYKKYSKYSLRNIEIINQAKNKSCEICGKQYDTYNMQLDHIDPINKYKNISQLKNFKIKTLVSEINKCRLLCALCHRRKSIWEQQAHKYPKNREKIIIKTKLFVDLINKIKECGKCHKKLLFNNYVSHKKSSNGLSSWCKNCFNEYRRDKRKVNNDENKQLL